MDPLNSLNERPPSRNPSFNTIHSVNESFLWKLDIAEYQCWWISSPRSCRVKVVNILAMHWEMSLKNLVEVKQKQDSGVTGFHPELLQPGLSNSIITTSDGNLTPRYCYLKAIMDATPKSDHMEMQSMSISLRGHLSDLGLINQIADAVEANGCSLTFRECTFPTGQFYH